MERMFKSPFASSEVARALLPHYVPMSRGNFADDDLALAAGKRLAAGHGTMDDAVRIVRWKVPDRTYGRFKAKNEWPEIKRVMRNAVALLKRGEDMEAIRVLRSLHMVATSTATAFACWLREGEFPLIDMMALRALGYQGAINDHVLARYIDFCRAEAQRLGMTIRDLDRALWVHRGTGVADAARRSICG